MSIRPLDRDALRSQFRRAVPYPYICIDNFLEPGYAQEVAASFPTYSKATELGRAFKAVNENLKVQVSDYTKLPPVMQGLSDALHSQQFLDDLSYITGMPKLLWDDKLRGGGMHQTASSGHLDVHVDFNRTEDSGLFRRLNILVYFNPQWEEAWGGVLELWDSEVKRRHHALAPVLNRCVIFETSETSYHGVTAVTCPDTIARKSFAGYYYTAEPPASYHGVDHSTIFKARPDEKLKGMVLMPAAKLRQAVFEGYVGAKQRIKSLIRP